MEAASLILDELEADGEKALDRLVSAAEETSYLDFKRKTDSSGQVEPSADDLRNYAKALSGFANSAGGLLIWGIAETKDATGGKVLQKSPINAPEVFRQRLDHLLPVMVSRPVDGVRNIVIQASAGGGFVATYVPESGDAPHRAEGREKRYFRRVGSNFVGMEHYEIEDMFGRRQRPKLELELAYTKDPSSTPEVHLYHLRASIHNNGRAMSRFYKVSMNLPAVVQNWPGDGTSLERRGSVALVHISDPALPLFPGDSRAPAFNGYRYHMTNEIFDRFEAKGYPDLEIEIFAEGTGPQRVSKSFRDLQRF
jgi:hypothetical protein